MGFSAFDKTMLEDYAKRAKEQWGAKDEYKEFSEKDKRRSDSDKEKLAQDTMELFAEFGAMRRNGADPADSGVQAQVKRLQDFITENFYSCTKDILRGLGQMYTADSEFSGSIDSAGGEGTAQFVHRAINIYCG